MIVYCSNCGKELWRKPYLIKKFNHFFCSRYCKSKYQIKNIEMVCDYCGKTYITKQHFLKDWNKHFCSVECRGHGLKKQLNKKKIIELYNVGISSEEIGRITNTSPITIRNRLSEWGIELRIDIPRGENHVFWNGGITSIHSRIRNVIFNSGWQSYILERDNYTCQICGATDKDLNVHHIIPYSDLLEEFLNKYNNLSDNELFDISHTYKPFLDTSNGLTLCVDCHKEMHNFKVNK